MFCHKKHPLFTFSELTEKKGPCSAQSSITAREFWQVTQIGTWVGKSDTFYIHHKRKILRNNFSVGIFFPGQWTSNTHNSLQWTFLKCQLRSNTFCIDTHVIWVIFYFYQMFAFIPGEEVILNDSTMITNSSPFTFILHYLALSCTIFHYLSLSCTILHYLAFLQRDLVRLLSF